MASDGQLESGISENGRTSAHADEMETKVHDDIKGTAYECSSLTRLSGGTANFTYRGILLKPLDDGTSTIVVKHAEPYVALSQSFELDVSRMYYEETMLRALRSLPQVEHEGIQVTTPTLHHYSSERHTSVMTDYPDSLELKTYITTHALSNDDISRLGNTIGKWLRTFHAWGAAAEQAGLRETMKGNTKMAYLKHYVNYGRTEETIEKFPEILGGCRDVFRAVEAKYRKELQAGRGQLIHGDFWSGNILLKNAPFPPPSPSPSLPLFIIDWELSHLSSLAYDLGQMFAELYLLTHFRSLPAGAALIATIMAGYGSLEEQDEGRQEVHGEELDLAFRVALHFGVHLIVWPCRVPGWAVEGEEDKEKEKDGKGLGKMERCVEFGRECVVRAWESDREWFRGGVLDGVFSR